MRASGFTVAVEAKLNAMVPGLELPMNYPQSFPDLQTDVLNAAGSFYNPKTGNPWDYRTYPQLVQTSSGHPWLGPSAKVEDREKQIAEVIAGLGGDSYEVPVPVGPAGSSWKSPKTPSCAAMAQRQGYPSQKLVQKWQELTAKVPSATPQFTPGGGYVGDDASWNNVSQSASVEFKRDFEFEGLPQPGADPNIYSLPIKGVPIDAAEVIVAVSSSGGDNGQVSPGSVRFP